MVYLTRFALLQIDEESPLFEMDAQSLLSSQFEIVVVMEGVTEETGNTVQGQTKPEPKSGGIRQKLNRSKVKKNIFLQLIMFRVTPT